MSPRHLPAYAKTMQNAPRFKLKKLISLLSLAGVGMAGASASFADTIDLGTVGANGGAAATPSVSAERGTAASVAPAQASLTATEPQSIISRAFIEASTPPTGNFNTILNIAPSVASMPSTNGPGLSDQKMTLRGFQDGEYNVTFDGIPFGDTNGPTHHSTAYFPAAVIGGMVIERGPGNASNIGYATYGGSVNIFSKVASATRKTSVYGSIGNWGTNLEGASYDTGRMAGSDATLQLNLQHMASDGYLTQARIKDDNFTAKYQRPIGDGTLLTAFASVGHVRTNTADNSSGPTAAQVAALGQNYFMNDDPHSQGYRAFNYQNKKTDMEYVRMQTAWSPTVETDNNTYTYAYDNMTTAGEDPSQFNGTADATLSFTNVAKKTVTLPNGDVPGYFKLNKYRVWGDVFKLTAKTDNGLLRAGAWFEASDTRRHNLEADLTTGTLLTGAKAGYPDGVQASHNFVTQYSSWHQIQPFVEYEWAPLPDVKVTPGFKLMSYNIGLHSALNQKSLTPQAYSYHYGAELPYLTLNKRFGDENSVYAQYAQGMMVPFAGMGLQTSTQPVPQTTKNYQFGAVHKSDRLTVDGDVYYITMDNMQANAGTKTNPEYVNVGGALYRGFEGEATYALVSGFALYANFSRTSATYDSGNAATTPAQPTGEIPNAPRITTGAGVLYNAYGWNASLLYKHIGEQLDSHLGGQLTPINNVDLNVAYTFTGLTSWGVKGLRVQGSVFNLTNSRKVTSYTDPVTPSTWQAPRSFMLSLKADL